MNAPQLPHLLAVRIQVAATALGISRSTLYRLVRSGELQSVKVSVRAAAIPFDSLARYAKSRGLDIASQPWER